MHGTRTLTLTQARLFVREPANVFFGLVFPALLMVAVGLLLPGMRDPIADAGPGLAGLRPIDIYLPVVLALAIATVALTTFPPTFGAYREKGILRRLSTTPLPASRLLVAEVSVNVVVLLVGVAAAVLAGLVLLDVPGPRQPILTAAVFLLGAVQMLAVGGLVAALVPTAGAASVTSMSLYFPMLFFAGVWVPAPLMSETLQRISAVVPLGAVAQALTEAWLGSGTPVLQLVVMAAWTAVLVPVAARVFRWS